MPGRPTTLKPALESLNGRLVPRAGGFSLPAGFAPGQAATTTLTATRFAVQVQRSAFAGSEAQVTVIALDSSGRPVKDYAGTVTLGSSDAAAALPAGYRFTAADRGVKVFDVSLPTAGSITVTAADADGLTGSATVTVPTLPTHSPGRPRRGR